MLVYIRDQINEFILEDVIENYTGNYEQRLQKHNEKLQICGNVLAIIDNKSLSKSIIRYIAPHFYLDKNDKLLV